MRHKEGGNMRISTLLIIKISSYTGRYFIIATRLQAKITDDVERKKSNTASFGRGKEAICKTLPIAQ